MRLIIAEKPSLARNIVAGIGTMTKKDGYFEGQGYIVSWAFGHLFSLCDIEDYTGDPPKTKWTLDNLPCFPEKFRFKLKSDKDGKTDAGVNKQFNILVELMNRSDVDMLINAGDADREGEIIVRLCMRHGLKSKKQIMRLWLPDQTPETVRAGLKDMKPDSDYNNLANEGYARTYIDWLYGVNLTRFASIRTGSLLRVGRVIVPIVKAIYDRDLSIRNFVPEKYFGLLSAEQTNGETVELLSKHKFYKEEEDRAKRACAKLNSQDAVVTDKKSKKDTLNPGKLYSLSKLQNYLGKKYKMSMDSSLKVIQQLYEDGYLTYPRTNSEYLATAEKEKIQKIIELLAGKGYPLKFKDSKSIFDDSKIESHSALSPTYKIPDPAKLSEDEKKVYSAVVNRFAAVFCAEECVAQKTEIKISVGGLEEFVLKGTVIVTPGWTRFDDTFKKDKILPDLNKGDKVNINFKPVEKQTSPPKHYTIETLNNYLKNPFKEDKAASPDDDTEDYKAIFEGLELGTEATRTGIIDNAVKSKYIELKKDVYYILPDGEFLIKALQKLGISMDKYKTSMLGQALKKVYHGEYAVADAVHIAQTEINDVFHAKQNDTASDEYVSGYGDEIGKCPICGKPMKKFKYGYGCTGYKEGCKFSISDTICGKSMSVKMVQELLTKGIVGPIDGFQSKKGKDFTASLKITGSKVEFVFTDKQAASPDENTSEGKTYYSSVSVGTCPLCGSPVVYRPKNGTATAPEDDGEEKGFYGCIGYKNGCKFGFNSKICEKIIDRGAAAKILKEGTSGTLNGFTSKDGKVFHAELVLKDGKLSFQFA